MGHTLREKQGNEVVICYMSRRVQIKTDAGGGTDGRLVRLLRDFNGSQGFKEIHKESGKDGWQDVDVHRWWLRECFSVLLMFGASFPFKLLGGWQFFLTTANVPFVRMLYFYRATMKTSQGQK